MTSAEIPDIVISRLPIYLRALTRMAADSALPTTSSGELGKRLGISSAQIRKDLSHFGEFGKQGTGYNIRDLINHLRRILKVEHEWDVAVIGAGAIGHALAHYNGFLDRGFRIQLIFDSDPAKIGTRLNGFEVYDVARLSEMLPAHNIHLAMLAVPAEAAQAVANELVQAGVRGILSYAPINIAVPETVRVQEIDPVVQLQRITYYA
ncbi:MAG: redox-sensing transcriptional repressor Rex [Anaerolineales bacterium]|nr:redox-sensing transcriptional repressor Rex [Anaerolineales bacterium]